MGTKSPGGPQRCRLILQRCLAIQLSKPGHTPEDFWMYDSGYMIFQVSSKSKLRELVSREIHELVTIIHQPPSTTVQCPFSLVPSSLCSTAVMSSLCLRLCSELSSVQLTGALAPQSACSCMRNGEAGPGHLHLNISESYCQVCPTF